MLQNARVAAFTVSELLSENKQGEGKTSVWMVKPSLPLLQFEDYITLTTDLKF